MPSRFTRRQFIKWGMLGGFAACLAAVCNKIFTRQKEDQEGEAGDFKKPEHKIPPEKKNYRQKSLQEDHLIPRRHLGKTGLTVSTLGLGGAITVAREERREEAEELINRALDLGINYIDTAPSYGYSENNIGRVMAHRRHEAYLASKTLERSYDGTMRLFEGSLERLQTDYLDLYQLHGIHSEEDLKQVLADDGALKALEELKSSGDIKFTGITGHKSASLLKRALQEYHFDCILMTVNCGDIHEDSLIKGVLPLAIQKKMGIMGMKVVSYGRLFREDGITSMEQAMGYALSQPVSTVITGISSVAELEENISIARDFTPFSREKMKQLEALTYPYKQEANFFKHEW